ncbi:FadR/GntR family transcriptional regulator [Macrococcus capreoli]|uniref:FadR/GntR family transcriptional regulator n=1 Tax=Macrococcus capreoli TaxID=2982690 RepID=UPI0021D5FE07|nr:FadR/GntR family transcriptional regulator [Macrococcus sp. TMW 2.2395]MCU7557009.1 FadR family transcriptional regulator [Macrococcus sp. TMW 2.2395]
MVKIEKKKLYEGIADLISEQIKNGDYQVNEKLPSIQKLAQDYGVGQASIREALNALRVMGLLEIRHGEGTFVKNIKPKVFSKEMAIYTKKDIIDLLEVRKIIEVGAAERAAQHRTTEDLNQIKQALDQMQLVINNKAVGEESDLAFHMSIARATKNELLIQLLEEVSDKIKTTMKETRKIWIYTETKSIEKLYKEHLEIYEAIETQSVERAKEKMLNHLEEVEYVLLEHLEID